MDHPSFLITLMTDFGSDSPYIAQMKGVALRLQPRAQFVDITHAVPPFHIAQAARVWGNSWQHFPPGTVHVGVVDPGVGSQRAILYARIAGHHFIAPDNGLLTEIVRHRKPDLVVSLTNDKYWNALRSTTFHGRDIMAPVAAHVLAGVSPQELGSVVDQWIVIDRMRARVQPGSIAGEISMIDSYGNLITNIGADDLATIPSAARATARVCLAERLVVPWLDHYAQAAVGSPLALMGSQGTLEVAVCQGHAQRELQAGVGDLVTVCW